MVALLAGALWLAAAQVAAGACADSDADIRSLRNKLCFSFGSQNKACCGGACDGHAGVTAHGQDWPSQAEDMVTLLRKLGSDGTCVNTTVAKSAVAWLDTMQTSTDPATSEGGFMWNFRVFQVQYYDMPRKPGSRIESPSTLGRKCWAFALLTQKLSVMESAQKRIASAASQNLSVFAAQYSAAVPQTMALCKRVMANCFVNASYDPSRKGSCVKKIAEFHYLGFERENVQRGFPVDYPF